MKAPARLVIGVIGSYVYVGVCDDGQPRLPDSFPGELAHVRVFWQGSRTPDYEVKQGLCRAAAGRATALDLECILMNGHSASVEGYGFVDSGEVQDCIGHLAACAERAEAVEAAYARA